MQELTLVGKDLIITFVFLQELTLDGNYDIRSPPPEIVAHGVQQILVYLKALLRFVMMCACMCIYTYKYMHTYINT